ncbi:MAG: GNAT family N-acetyltransferase [Nitrosomonas sp.]|nr:GNAT family N-acetyltransferase [Nitrosomonas sp.]
MTPLPYQLQLVRWSEAAPLLRIVRESVFIQEQQVPVELEWDEFDPVCIHVLALTQDGKPVGTARLLPNGHIGRMAVIKSWRGKGIGRAMLQCLLDTAKQNGITEIKLNSQISAKAFYERFGFQVSGDEFMEADIPHIKMFLTLFG